MNRRSFLSSVIQAGAAAAFLPAARTYGRVWRPTESGLLVGVDPEMVDGQIEVRIRDSLGRIANYVFYGDVRADRFRLGEKIVVKDPLLGGWQGMIVSKSVIIPGTPRRSIESGLRLGSASWTGCAG